MKTKTQLAEEAAMAVSKVVTLEERERIIQSAIEKAVAQDRRGDCHLCKLPFTNLVEHYAAAHPRAAHASIIEEARYLKEMEAATTVIDAQGLTIQRLETRAAHASEAPTETPESKSATEAYPKPEPAHASEFTDTTADSCGHGQPL